MSLNIKSILRSLFLFGVMFQFGAGIIRADSERWTNIGPFTGGVLAVAIDPSAPGTIYAGTHGAGVFKSTDGGASWTASNSGLTSSNFF